MLYPELTALMEKEGLDSRYSLVIVTAKRARQIAGDSDTEKTVSKAIEEIAEGKVKWVPSTDGEASQK